MLPARFLLPLLLAASACATAPAVEPPAPSPIAEAPAPPPVAVGGAVPSVPPDPWAWRVARSMLSERRPETDASLDTRSVARRALLVRGRDQADAIQGFLIDKKVALDSVDGSGHLLRMGASVRLAALGYTASRVKALDSAGVPIVAAAVAAQEGKATLDDYLVLSPTVLVVEALEAPMPVDLGDGLDLSQRLRVVERLKGETKEGAELILRTGTLDGTEPAKAALFTLAPGQRQLAFLSNDAYRHAALVRAAPPSLAPAIVSHIGPPRHIRGDALVPLPGEEAPSMAALRSRLASLDATDSGHRGKAARPAGIEGLWMIDRVDGRPVDPWRYWVQVRGGLAMAGHDDCNWWGAERRGAGWSFISTEIGCAADPARAAYHAVLRGSQPARGEALPDGSLRFAGGGHVLTFRRTLD